MQWYTPCAPLCSRHARAHAVPHLRAGSAPVRAVGARHARVCPILHVCAIGTSSYVGNTHVSALSRTCVRGQHRYAAAPSQGLPDSSLADRAGREPSCVAAVRDVDCPPDLAHSRWASSFPLPPSPLSQTSFHTHTQHLHFPHHIQHASPHTLHTLHVPHTHPARIHTHTRTRAPLRGPAMLDPRPAATPRAVDQTPP